MQALSALQRSALRFDTSANSGSRVALLKASCRRNYAGNEDVSRSRHQNEEEDYKVIDMATMRGLASLKADVRASADYQQNDSKCEDRKPRPNYQHVPRHMRCGARACFSCGNVLLSP